jgi:hypothetical protein
MGSWHAVVVSQLLQSVSELQVASPTAGRPLMPQDGVHVPWFRSHALPEGQAFVAEHCAQTCLLHAVAGALPAVLHAEQSWSATQEVGQAGTQALLALQMSVDWQFVVLVVVQPPQAPLAQTWCFGSQAPQSTSVLHATVGMPFESVGHVTPAPTQSPYCVHV